MDAENRSDQQRNFDQWLDSALRARLNAEPRMGLEDRVLARLASEPAHHTFGWRPLLVMASAAALSIAIASALLQPMQLQRTMANRASQATTPNTADRASLDARSVPSREGIHKRTRSEASVSKDGSCCEFARVAARSQSEEHLPKSERFPLAHPETEQERMLAQLAAQLTPQQQFSEVARLSLDSRPKDLSIKQLSIEPLETPANSSPQE